MRSVKNLLKYSPSYCKTERAVNLLNAYIKDNKPAESDQLKEYQNE